MIKKDKKSICEIISISVMSVFAVISFFILPDTIAIQWNGTQASSYGSRWFIFLPVGVPIIIEAVLCVVVCGIYALKKRG